MEKRSKDKAKKLPAEEICGQALSIVQKFIFKEPETIIGIKKDNGEWKVEVETLERKAVPDTQDLLGRYELRLNESGQLIGWEQVMIRRRSDRLVLEEKELVII